MRKFEFTVDVTGSVTFTIECEDDYEVAREKAIEKLDDMDFGPLEDIDYDI